MMSKDLVYFDYAAATPMDPQVFAAMQPFFTDAFYNPSASYLAARAVKQELEKARSTVAGLLGVRPSEIIFTAGGTEANNLAIKGVVEQYPGSKVITSAVEHDSVLGPVERFDHDIVPVKADGQVDLDALTHRIDERTVLVSVMYANNEIGTIQPIRSIARLIAAVRSQRRAAGNDLPLHFHTDAAQAANYLDLHVSRLGVDLMTLNGGKIYGPKQSGVLYGASHVRFTPQIEGGGQEWGHRSGTENVAFAVGLATALQQAQTTRHESVADMKQLQQYFMQQIRAKLPAAVLNGSLKQRLPNNIHITLPGRDNERLIFGLDEQGILAAAGSACSAESGEPSHVLRAIGLSPEDVRASLRFTMGRYTSTAHIDRAIETLASLV
jgi:cysteine desulfurase